MLLFISKATDVYHIDSAIKRFSMMHGGFGGFCPLPSTFDGNITAPDRITILGFYNGEFITPSPSTGLPSMFSIYNMRRRRRT